MMDKAMMLADAAAMGQLQAHAWMVLAMLAAGLVLAALARRARRRREGRLQGLMRPTLTGRLADPLPADAQLIAGIGAGRPARQSLDAQVMRASLGLRLLVPAVVGLMLWLWLGTGLFSGGTSGLTPVRTPVMELLVTGAGLWSALWTFTWELRWDRDGIVLTRLVFFRTTRRWRDLDGILDSRNHDYVLTFGRGGRLRVLKYATGIDAFLAQAATVLRGTDGPPSFAGPSESAPCPNFPKSKPSAAAFSRPWRGGAS